MRDYVFEIGCKAKGRMRFAVVKDGVELYDYGWKDNVILDQGLDRISDNSWASNLAYLAQGTSNTAATTSQTGLVAEAGARSNTYPSGPFGDGYSFQDMILDPSNAIATMRRTIDGPVFPSGENLEEFGLSHTSTASTNLFNRVVSPSTVVIPPGGQPRITYELSIQVPGVPGLQTVETGNSTGWPIEYTITDITSTVSDFTVTLDEAHHYEAGGKVNIDGTTNYDGEWTIDSIPSSTTIRILDTSNFATESSGTVKNNVRRKFVAVKYGFNSHISLAGLTNPSGSYLGKYFGDSTSSSTSNDSGQNSTHSIFDGNWNGSSGRLGLNIINTKLVAPPTNFPSSWYTTSAFHLGGTQAGRTNMGDNSSGSTPSDGSGYYVTGQSYTNGTFYRDYIFTFGAGIKNFSNINAIMIGQGLSNSSHCAPGYILFEELQRKKNTHTLSITIRRTWGRL